MRRVTALLCLAFGTPATATLAGQSHDPDEGIGVTQSVLLFKEACYDRFPDVRAMWQAITGPGLSVWRLKAEANDGGEEQRWTSKFADVALSGAKRLPGGNTIPFCSVTVNLHGRRTHVELVSALFYLIQPKPTQISWTSDEGPSAWKLSRPQGDQQIELTTTYTADDDTVWNIKLTNLPTRAN